MARPSSLSWVITSRLSSPPAPIILGPCRSTSWRAILISYSRSSRWATVPARILPPKQIPKGWKNSSANFLRLTALALLHHPRQRFSKALPLRRRPDRNADQAVKWRYAGHAQEHRFVLEQPRQRSARTVAIAHVDGDEIRRGWQSPQAQFSCQLLIVASSFCDQPSNLGDESLIAERGECCFL